MRGSAQACLLTVNALLGGALAADRGTPSVLKSTPSNVCDVSNGSSCAPAPTQSQSPKQPSQYSPGATVSDACATFHTLEQLNNAIHPYLHTITTETDFFSHYRLNLFNKKCPFWDDENGMCGNVACAVLTLDNEEDIPLVWRAKELGKLEGPTAPHPGRKQQKEHKKKPLEGSLGEDVGESCVVEYDDECDDRDYCVPEDESASAKGDYVSLVANPERYTGYAGAGAAQVWQAIYRENCFNKPPKDTQSQLQSSHFGNEQQLSAANQLWTAMKQQGIEQNIKNAIAHNDPAARQDPIELDDTCLEKRVFHRVISGMHASITTHLCWEWLNKTSGQWEPNLECYKKRLEPFPDRVANIYFNYALVLRAVGKIQQHIKDYTYCSEDLEQDKDTKAMVLQLSRAIPAGEEIFDETIMFQDPASAVLKEDFRNKFRNVSRIMDCVGCDKCRLWGKVQTAGYGTALKVLFEFDEQNSKNDPPLRRTELVALLNTLDRLSHSLSAIAAFRNMVREEGSKPAADLPIDPKIAKIQASLSPEEKKKKEETPNFSRDWDPDELSILDNFKAELNLVFRVWMFVMKRWWNLPKTL